MIKHLHKVFSLVFLAILALICMILVLNRGAIWQNRECKISVIVPVYNTERYLDECLNSIENQTLKDIEIICINDGSKDRSGEILEQHRKKDDRIKIINQENAGVSVARNRGIACAVGEYISFVDSDDILAPYFYEKAYENVKKNNADIIDMKFRTFYHDIDFNLEGVNYNDNNTSVHEVTNDDNPFEALRANIDIVWNKLWKRSMIVDNGVEFPEGVSNSEDMVFNLFAISYAKKSVVDDNICYFYRINRPGSATTNKPSKEKICGNYLKIARYMVENEYKFKFKGYEKWLADWVIRFNYKDLTEDFEGQEELQKKYVAELLEILEPYIKDKNIELSGEIKEQWGILQKIGNDRNF